MVTPLSLDEIHDAAARLRGRIDRTPTLRLQTPEVTTLLGPSTEMHLKLELFQRTGTFKARGALLNALDLSADAHGRGVTAISAGNHAAAVAFAAQSVGVNAKVVMFGSVNPLRVELCRSYGAEIVFTPDAHAGFEHVQQLADRERRTLIHPFEGRTTALGTA